MALERLIGELRAALETPEYGEGLGYVPIYAAEVVEVLAALVAQEEAAAASEAMQEAVDAVRSFVVWYEKYHGFLGDVTPEAFEIVCNAALQQPPGAWQRRAEWLAEAAGEALAEAGCDPCRIRELCQDELGCRPQLLAAAIRAVPDAPPAEATDGELLDALEGRVLYNAGDGGYWCEQGFEGRELLPDIYAPTLRDLAVSVKNANEERKAHVLLRAGSEAEDGNTTRLP